MANAGPAMRRMPVAEMDDTVLERIPWRRAGQPEEIARAILDRASGAADGGLTVHWGGA